MNTPIFDFVKKYNEDEISRLHMPGHKGKNLLGVEYIDITEISGADSLYHADSIISESEKNATTLFGSCRTFYSTEGSTHCIKSMVALARTWAMMNTNTVNYHTIVALRNVHKSFINTCALLDIDVEWIFPDNDNNSICECKVELNEIENTLSKTDAFALYITSPDYLGNIADIKEISDLCHKFGKLLLVDNAHGAYLNFLDKSFHPISLGADLCCDSAHKTLPVLTGGAYLHLSHTVSQLVEYCKDTMSLFGSTSPSYLILESLDLCNQYLYSDFSKELSETVSKVAQLKEYIKNKGFSLIGNEPVKITIFAKDNNVDGEQLANHLREFKIECEFADRDFVVLMFSACNDEKDYKRVREAFNFSVDELRGKCSRNMMIDKHFLFGKREKITSIRQAVLSPQKKIDIHEAAGQVCGMTVVSCPPAIPIIVSGERIDEEMIEILQYYNMEKINVVNV